MDAFSSPLALLALAFALPSRRRRGAENDIGALKRRRNVVPAMTGDARPVCPQCGAPLFQRHHGDLACVQHGLFYSAQVLDSTFGNGTSQRVAQLAARSAQAPRKCPDDRNGMSAVSNGSGSVRADACQRCGGVWMPLATLENVERTTPAPDGASPSDARAMLGLAACRALVQAQVASRSR